LRLPDVENQLKQAIYDYIDEVYPYAVGGKPEVKVLDEEQFRRESVIKGLPAFYNIRENALYFREFVTHLTVAHEVHHWFQAQEIGPEEFIKVSRAWKLMLVYEKAADDVALRNGHKLNWPIRGPIWRPEVLE